MKKLLFLIIIFCALKANAQDYLISFAGADASTILNTVKVENLMKGTTLTINGNDILRLTTTAGKGTQATVDMAYTTGDRLKFTGISGNYSTVKTDIPTSDKTITFNFIACTDGGGNNYPVVEIWTQIWMAENLRATKYNDGTDIPFVTDNTDWSNLATPAYSWYLNNQAAYENPYGAYYNWYAANNSKLCPTGWHVPTISDLSALKTFLGEQNPAGKIKETGTTHWITTSTDVTNETGLTLVPGGDRGWDGNFGGIRNGGDYWSSTESGVSPAYGWDWGCSHDESPLYFSQYYEKLRGFSVRCLSDLFITSLKIPSTSNIKIYPNPVSGILTLEYKNENYESVRILNSQGVLLTRKKTILPVQQLDFSKYVPGLYFLEFARSTGEIRRFKVVKQQ
jgi:uncharacterized protein (TIGR02145 family)